MNNKSIRSMGWVLIVGAFLGMVLLLIPRDEGGDLRERAEKAAEMMNKEQMEDGYGGVTPEETLKLFTDALKKGDTELASRYFLPEHRKENNEYLDSVVKMGNLQKLISDLGKAELKAKTDSATLYLEENGIVVSELFLDKSPYTGRWKITAF